MAIVKCNHSSTCAPFLLFFELRHCQILTRLPGVRPFHAGELFVTLLVGGFLQFVDALLSQKLLLQLFQGISHIISHYNSLYNFYIRISGFLCPLVLHERYPEQTA